MAGKRRGIGAAEPQGKPTEAARHVYGPRAIGALLPAITRPAFRRRAPAAASLMADWPAVIGPALAAVTSPLRLSAGVLTLACPGPIALELQHLAPELIRRVNLFLGRETVTKLGFAQTLPERMADGAPSPPPSPALRAAAEEAVAALPAGALRDALAGLGAAVLREEGLSTRHPQKG